MDEFTKFVLSSPPIPKPTVTMEEIHRVVVKLQVGFQPGLMAKTIKKWLKSKGFKVVKK